MSDPLKPIPGIVSTDRAELHWVHDATQVAKYGEAYLNYMVKRCEAFRDLQFKVLGMDLVVHNGDTVGLEFADRPPEEDPRIADFKLLNKMGKALAEELDLIDQLEDLPPHFWEAFLEDAKRENPGA